MIKLDEIKIKGYKNIESAELKLGTFNVIIGANNSGKSNFIQTISFLNYMINSSLDDVQKSFSNGFSSTYFKEIIPFSTIEDFRVGESEKVGLIVFELAFSNSETNRIFTYFLEIEWKASLVLSEYKIKTERLEVKESNKPGPSTNIFHRTYEAVKYGTEFSKMDVIEKIPSHFSVIRVLKIIAEVKEDYKDAIDSLNEIIKTPIFYFSNIELLKTDKDRLNSFNGRIVSFDLEQEIIALEDGKQWDVFKEAIKDILSIENIMVHKYSGDLKNKISPKRYLFFVHHGTLKSLNQLSDGTILIIALVTKILCTKNHLFLIEEPENSTHPKALIDLISFIKSFSENTQFIITSHSIAILNKTRVEDIIASSINDKGFCELYNVSSKKGLKAKLKRSRVNFSDELFFAIDDKNEFE